MKKQLLTLLAVCGLAIAASAQTKTTLATNAECKIPADKEWAWVTGMYKSDPITYDKTKGAIVEITFKSVSLAQKFRVNVQDSKGTTDKVDMSGNAAVGSVVRVEIATLEDIQQIALQNMSTNATESSVSFDAVLISDIDYAAATAVPTILVNEDKNTAVTSETLKSLGDYDILTVTYNVAAGMKAEHEGWGVGAVCNNIEKWPSIYELSGRTGSNSVSFYVADIKNAIDNGIVFNFWGQDGAAVTFTGITVQKCKSKVTPVASVDADVEVISSEYYTLSGAKVSEPAKGVNILVEKLSDGTMRTTKIVKK